VSSARRSGRPTSARRNELILDALERLLASVPLRELDVEAIAAEASITRTRFYAYYPSKNAGMAALLRRMAGILSASYEHPDSCSSAGRRTSARVTRSTRRSSGPPMVGGRRRPGSRISIVTR
jgi:AcrR family transcriptional regulator